MSGRPFSLESFQRSVAAIILWDGHDALNNAVEVIHRIVARGRKLMEFLKTIALRALPRHPPPPPPCRTRHWSPGRAGGGARRSGKGDRDLSLTRSVVSVASSASSAPMVKRPRTAAAFDASQGAPPLGDDSHLAALGVGITIAM